MKKFIGAYAAVVKGTDAGLYRKCGRKKTAARQERQYARACIWGYLDVEINAPGTNDVLISKQNFPVKVIKVTVNEELEIAGSCCIG